ncbi:MAG: hypothetical protein PHX93_02650 [Candidatus Peribacteraceae bacterium]|jgi:hypothetical protein|nr:hypothetical protein [Candidatus Peribacteraceae bacterium]
MTKCTPLERLTIAGELHHARVKCDKRELFRDPERALTALSGYMTWYHRALTEAADPDEQEELRRIGPWTAEFGSRILQMTQPDVAGLQEETQLVLRKGYAPELLDRHLDQVFSREFGIGDVTVDEIAEDLRQERGGFATVPTPSVPPVIAALQRDRKSKSHVLALNAGGTSEQIGYANATSEHVHIEDLQTHRMENKPCQNADDFWALHFPGETEARLRAADPD